MDPMDGRRPRIAFTEKPRNRPIVSALSKMTLFEVPDVTMQKTRNDAWCKKIGGKHLGGPRELRGDYWRRFNTMQIPMLGEDEYFETATAIAEGAANEEEFEKLFMKRNKQREEELLDLIDDITEAIAWDKGRFPCRAARHAALNASRTGCFEYFVSLLRGNVLGWEADRAGDDASNNSIAHFGEEAQKPDDEEVQGSSDYEDCIDYAGSFGHKGSPSPCSPSSKTQRWGDTDHFYAMEDLEAYIESKRESKEAQEYREKRAKDIQEINSSDEEDMGHHGYGRRPLKGPVRHISAATASPNTNTSSIEPTTPGNSRKRVNFHKDDDDREHKRQRTQSPVPTLPSDAPSTQQSAAGGSVKRRRSDGDEDDVEDDVDHGHKRQRTQSPAPAASPAAASVRQPAVANSKKRYRTNDGDDDDKGNQGRKRQKMENTTSDPTPPVSPSTREAADGNVAKKRRRVSGRRKSRGQNSFSGILNPTSAEVGPQPLRRSVRRNNQYTLHELDRSGKSRPIR